MPVLALNLSVTLQVLAAPVEQMPESTAVPVLLPASLGSGWTQDLGKRV